MAELWFAELPLRSWRFGVFCVINGRVKLAAKDFTGPNGLAFSPDERYLYVDDWDGHHKAITATRCGPTAIWSTERCGLI